MNKCKFKEMLDAYRGAVKVNFRNLNDFEVLHTPEILIFTPGNHYYARVFFFRSIKCDRF